MERNSTKRKSRERMILGGRMNQRQILEEKNKSRSSIERMVIERKIKQGSPS